MEKGISIGADSKSRSGFTVAERALIAALAAALVREMRNETPTTQAA